MSRGPASAYDDLDFRCEIAWRENLNLQHARQCLHIPVCDHVQKP